MSTIKSSTEHLTLNADGAAKDIKFQANGVEKASISSAGAFTSTSIDATKLSGALPAIDGSALTGSMGKVLQVVHYRYGYNSTTITINSQSATATGISKTVTPKSSNSTFFVWITLQIDSNVRYELSLHKNGSNVITGGTNNHFAMGNNAATSNGHHQINGFIKTDNSSTSPLTFEVYGECVGSGDSFVINTHNWGENALIIMEVEN
jgi:hypothetical protein